MVAGYPVECETMSIIDIIWRVTMVVPWQGYGGSDTCQVRTTGATIKVREIIMARGW